MARDMDTNKILELMREFSLKSAFAFHKGEKARYLRYQQIVEILEQELRSRDNESSI